MSRLFISNSSANNAEAMAIRHWLAAEGRTTSCSISTPSAAIVEIGDAQIGVVQLHHRDVKSRPSV